MSLRDQEEMHPEVPVLPPAALDNKLSPEERHTIREQWLAEIAKPKYKEARKAMVEKIPSRKLSKADIEKLEDEYGV
ncbi:hypothetical protein C8R44DRAFT_808107 [Mycena epipterygia]|nr:hypothetical protein C8R44DRAFT_808107 [Mycena epipterygia]